MPTFTWSATASGSANSPEMAQLLLQIPLHAFHFNTEEELHEGLAALLTQLGLKFLREYALGKHGRIDFYLPAPRLGLEVKVQGSPSAVVQQLHGYAQHKDIGALLLVTSRMRLGRLPAKMRGKPVAAVGLGANWM